MRDALMTNRTRRAQIVSILTGAGAIERGAVVVASIAALVAAGSLSACDGATFGLFCEPSGSTEASITSGQPTLVCADPQSNGAAGPFTAADVGKSIDVAGAGAAGAVLSTTIAAYVSATTVTLADNASTTIAANSSSAAGVCVWGWPLSVVLALPNRMDANQNTAQAMLDPTTGLPKSFGGSSAETIWTSKTAYAPAMSASLVSLIGPGEGTNTATDIAIGTVLRVKLVIRMAKTVNGNCTFKILLNGLNVFNPAANPVTVNGAVWTIEGDFTFTAIGVTGNVMGYASYTEWNYSAPKLYAFGFVPDVIDTTSGITVDVQMSQDSGTFQPTVVSCTIAKLK